ncbi:hypothetical protein [Tenacibaculum halocynthiae]|uniref:hypothetical protein n=1 Tax=Tenacibaculum halocynthiae TaxID=1254437 RepID=UPI003D64EABF
MRLTSIREVIEELFDPEDEKIKGKSVKWWMENFKCHPDNFAKEVRLDQTSLIAKYFGYAHDDIVISIIQKLK